MKFTDGTWLNPPPTCAIADEKLTLTTGEKTDFWQSTHYGFRRDDGHFLGFEAPAACDAVLSFDSAFDQLYDQAGIMLHQGPDFWIKAGIEYSDNVLNYSVVVTRDGRSDWAVQPVPGASGPFSIRLIRVGGAVIVYRALTVGWQLIRLADFPEGPAQIGPTACTPERAGLEVSFFDFTMRDPPAEPLHLEEA